MMVMRKIHIMGLALVAIFMFAAVGAMVASAEEPLEFLVGGASLKEEGLTGEAVATENILFEDSKATGKPNTDCSFILDGVLVSNCTFANLFEVLEVLM